MQDGWKKTEERAERQERALAADSSGHSGASQRGYTFTGEGPQGSHTLHYPEEGQGQTASKAVALPDVNGRHHPVTFAATGEAPRGHGRRRTDRRDSTPRRHRSETPPPLRRAPATWAPQMA